MNFHFISADVSSGVGGGSGSGEGVKGRSTHNIYQNFCFGYISAASVARTNVLVGGASGGGAAAAANGLDCLSRFWQLSHESAEPV